MDKFNALQIFLTAAKTGSFAGAAKSLGTNPSTVSKAIDRLEKEIGFSLFQRSTRKLRITESGEKYRHHVEQSLTQLSSVEEGILSEREKPHGVLKINAPVSYGRLYITPTLAEFTRLYPDITIDLSLDDAYVDIIENGHDISIRSGTIQDSRLVAQQLSAMETVTIASPNVAETLDKPIAPQDFPVLPWIQFRFKQTGRILPIHWQGKNQIETYKPEPTHIVDDGETLLAMCSDGMGYTQLPHFLVRDAILKNRVTPVMKSFAVPNAGIYAIYAKREYLPKRVTVFVEFMKKVLAEKNESPRKTWAMKLDPLKDNSLLI